MVECGLVCAKRERGVGGVGKVHMAGLTAGHHWVLGGCECGLWLLGDWKLCQAQ